MHTMGIDPESLCLTARIFTTVPIVAYRCFTLSTFNLHFKLDLTVIYSYVRQQIVTCNV